MKISKSVVTKILYVAAILFTLFGLYIRFNNIGHVNYFGWDETRDAYKVRDIIRGQLTLEGPRTGIGHFHLGPLYFYLLVPFYLMTHLDPIASQYLNILLNLCSFIAVFFVTRKLFSQYMAVLFVGMYAINDYLTYANRTPWNVSLIPFLSFFIFYFFYKTFEEKRYKWAAWAMTLCGMAFHAHFSALIFPITFVLLWLVNKDKKKTLFLLLTALPFYIIWFIPTIIDYFVTNHSDYFLARDFLQYYFVGFHLKFLLYRLPDILLMFPLVLSVPFSYVLLCGTAVRFFWRSTNSEKAYIKIIFAWLISYLLIFGVYGGQISEYYFLFTLPAVYYTLAILIQWLFTIPNKIIASCILAILIGCYIYLNIVGYRDPGHFGLIDQEALTKKEIKQGKVINYSEGDITSYLYLIYTNKR